MPDFLALIRRGIRLPPAGWMLAAMLALPACELAPYRVPCGPASASTRAMS